MNFPRCWLVLALVLWLLGQAAADSAAADAGPATLPAAATPAVDTDIPPGLRVAIIPVEGEIYGFTLQSLQRRVARALASGATAVVVEIDSPGGTLVSSLEISRYLKSLSVPTVAWVHNSAYSGAAVLATACRQIVMSPASVIGDCAPIVPTQSLEATERAKALSPLLSELRDSARRHGYDYALLHAMCVLGVEVYLVEHAETGQRRAVNAADLAVMVHGQDPQTADRGQRGWFGLGGGGTDSGRASVDVATGADRGHWKLVRKIHDGQTLLTLSQAQAVEVGLARSDQVAQTTDLERYLKAAATFRVAQTWSESVANWLTSPMIRGILIMALLLGGYVEMQSPGLGLPGGIALLALVALIGAPFMVGLAEIWHLILLALGLMFLAVEIFLTPGFGFLGVTGLALILAGLVLGIVPSSGDGPIPLPDPAMAAVLRDSLLWTLAAVVLAAIGLFWLTRYFGRIPVLNRLVLSAAQTVPGEFQPVSGSEAVGGGSIAVGDIGQTTAPLRPTGRARFGDRVVDVVSLAEWIEPGRRVRVVEIAGNRIVVEALS